MDGEAKLPISQTLGHSSVETTQVYAKVMETRNGVGCGSDSSERRA